MSFGFGVGDIVLVVNGGLKFWTTIRDASTEQAELAATLQLLREIVQTLTDNGSLRPPKLSPAKARVLAQYLLRCSKNLQDLDQTAAKYMGDSSSVGGSNSEGQNKLRLYRWGLYKRDEFVQSLEGLRKLVLLAATYGQLEYFVPPSPNSSHGCEPLRLIDALDRETVCSIPMCNTWEVCYLCWQVTVRY